MCLAFDLTSFYDSRGGVIRLPLPKIICIIEETNMTILKIIINKNI